MGSHTSGGTIGPYSMGIFEEFTLAYWPYFPCATDHDTTRQVEMEKKLREYARTIEARDGQRVETKVTLKRKN